MNATYITRQPIPQELTNLLMPDGLLTPAPFADIDRFGQELLSLFCHEHGLYQVPTEELIDWLDDAIGDRSAIEIGAGLGGIGRALGIPMTDSKLQDGTIKSVADYYDAQGIPRINYPADVQKATALSAVVLYKPDVIIGSWITQKGTGTDGKSSYWGVEEWRMAKPGRTYIHIGNERTHGDKLLLTRYPVQRVQADWLVSRSPRREDNVIYVFNF